MSAVETWVMFDEGWKLPVRVTWGEGRRTVARVELHPDLPALKCWRKVVEEKLAQACFSQDGAWFVTAEDLDEMACQAPDGEADLEAMVQWSPEKLTYRLPAVGQVLPRDAEGAERRAFLERFVDSFGLTLFQSIEELEVFYFALCNFMMAEMLEKNRPVNVVFARLFAAPLWTGWPNRIQQLARELNVGMWKGDNKIGLSGLIYNVRNRVAHQATRTETRSLHLNMTAHWWETMRAGEELRRKHLRELHYVKLIDSRLKGTLPLLIENYHSWLLRGQYVTLAECFEDVGIRPYRGQVYQKRPKAKGREPNAGCFMLHDYVTEKQRLNAIRRHWMKVGVAKERARREAEKKVLPTETTEGADGAENADKTKAES